MRSPSRLLAWLLLPSLLSTRPASATIFTWNAGSGTTNTSVNWSPVALPGANDDTRYWQSVIYGITTGSPADTCNSVWVSSTGTPKFSCGDPLRVRNAFQVDGGVTASILAGTVHAGWFTVGPGSLTITGNGTQAIATNNSATSYFGNSSGFTTTVNVSGGATFNGNNIQVPEFTGVTGILNVAGHPTTGMASSLHALSLYVGRQGVGDLELSAGGYVNAGTLFLGSNAYGRAHVFRGSGFFAGTASLLATEIRLGNNFDSSPGGTGVLTVDSGVTQTVFSVIMGDDDGGGPDTLRMNGGSMTVGDRIYQNANNSSVLDLHGGTLFINDSNTDFGSSFNQAVPLSIDGAGGGPVMTLYGAATANLKTTTPLSLIVGRSGGGTLNMTGFGAGSFYPEDLEVSGNVVVADQATGTGVINADQAGGVAAQGTLTVGPGNGLVQARHGGYVVARSEMDVLASGATGGTMLAKDSLSVLDPFGGLAIAGTLAAPTPGPATVRVDSLGNLTMNGTPLHIWGGGGKLEVGEGGTASVDTALCSGEVQLVNGNIIEANGIAAFHLLNGGVMHGVGRVKEAVSLDDTTARLEILASDPPGTLTVGDSLRSDSFRSQGIVRIETDTLALLAKGGPDLGHVVLAGGTLRLPLGGHLRVGDVLEGTGRIEGSLLDDGLVNAGAEIDVPGHLTVLSGDIAGTGLTVPPGGELSARGHVSGLLSLGGQFDMGTALAKLTMSRAPALQPTNLLTMRIGSAAHGAQDTLVVNEALAIAGTLDLRTWKPDPSAPGDTLTLITAPSLSGAFSKVTIDGVDAPSYVQVIYEPTRVRVVVLQSTVDVPPPSPLPSPSIALRFAVAGAMVAPQFALDLPLAASVQVCVFDVSGRRIAELARGRLDAGRYRFSFAGRPGVFFARAWVTDSLGRHVLGARAVRLP